MLDGQVTLRIVYSELGRMVTRVAALHTLYQG
jgi:hypothetical protein